MSTVYHEQHTTNIDGEQINGRSIITIRPDNPDQDITVKLRCQYDADTSGITFELDAAGLPDDLGLLGSWLKQAGRMLENRAGRFERINLDL